MKDKLPKRNPKPPPREPFKPCLKRKGVWGEEGSYECFPGVAIGLIYWAIPLNDLGYPMYDGKPHKFARKCECRLKWEAEKTEEMEQEKKPGEQLNAFS